MKKIAFIQLVCPTYKVDLFSAIKKIYNVDYYFGESGGVNIAPSSKSIVFNYSLLKNVFFNFLGVQWVWQSGIPFLKLRKYDLVVLSPSVPYLSNYFVIFLCKIFGVKIGFYGMGINYQKVNNKSSGALESIRSLIYKFTDFVVVYTDEIKHALVNKRGVDEKKVFVARNTLDVEKFISTVVSRDVVLDFYEIPKGDIVVTYVGRVSEEKNPWYLLEVLEALDDKLPITVVFVGDGPAMPKLQFLVNALPEHLKEKVKLLGRKEEDQTTEILKVSDYSVMPGMTGLAVVHSMACGTNYITVSSTLHSPEFFYIKNGVNAWVVEDSSAAISRKIVEIQADELLHQFVSNEAVEYCRYNLSIKSQIDGFKAAFNSVGIV